MREILFRGKGHDSGEWVYGNLRVSRLKDDPTDYVDIYPVNVGYPDFPMAESVYSETVGQYTGLTDKNGTKIFEGDILAQEGETVGFPVRYGVHSCTACDGVTGVYGFACKYDLQCISKHEKLVVIGNIYDNPELLGGDNNGVY